MVCFVAIAAGVMMKSWHTGVSRHVNVAGPGVHPGASSRAGKTQRFGIAQIAEEKVKGTHRYKNFTAVMQSMDALLSRPYEMYVFTGLGRENMAALAAICGDNPEDDNDMGEGEVPFEQEVLMGFAPGADEQGLEAQDDGWEDIPKEESIAHVIRDLVDVQYITISALHHY